MSDASSPVIQSGAVGASDEGTKHLTKRQVVVTVAMFVLWTATHVQADPAPIPQHLEVYAVDSGPHDGAGSRTRTAYSTIVASPDAAWLQLHFGDCKLGKESYLLLTGLEDGEQQRLDARSLEVWQHASAYFNGDAVSVDLYVAPGDAGVSVNIHEIAVGDWVGGEPRGGCSWDCGICDGDDRTLSADPRVGRLTGGCTGWIVSNGAYLAAGHCISPSGSLGGQLHFNIPLSNCDGTINHPAVQDQYPVLQASIVGQNTAGWDDWAVFACGPNSNTGLLPVQGQGAFFRMKNDFTFGEARVTGYGLDGDPVGCTGTMNAWSNTQQTHSGSCGVVEPLFPYLAYGIDVTCGNSGGPLMLEDGSMALGIISRCTNTCTFGSNKATSFANSALENVLQTFLGPVVEHVDAGHPSWSEGGNVFHPHDTVSAAVAAAPSGALISIVAGNYPAAAGNTFTAGADGRSMTLRAPVGLVRIGD